MVREVIGSNPIFHPGCLIHTLKRILYGACSITVSAAVCDIAGVGSIPIVYPKKAFDGNRL